MGDVELKSYVPLGCDEFPSDDGRGCCISCHEDADQGFDELTEVYFDIPSMADDIFANVCCRRSGAAKTDPRRRRTPREQALEAALKEALDEWENGSSTIGYWGGSYEAEQAHIAELRKLLEDK